MWINTSDSYIQDKENIIYYIIERHQSNNEIHLYFNTDGPCLRSIGFYELLDSVCDRFKIDKKSITIAINNPVEHHDQYNIKFIPSLNYRDSFTTKLVTVNKIFNDKFKYFSNFVAHGTSARLRIGSYLFNNHKDKTLQTYHVNLKDYYSKSYICLEEIMGFLDVSQIEYNNAVVFLSNCPLKLEPISLPILYPDCLDILKYYNYVFVDIVTFSYFSGNTFCFDEKLLRPIFMKTPFIIQGPQYFIKRLKQLGFKTFNNFWDEGYSDDPANYQVNEIFKIIDKISQYSLNDLKNMYNIMQPILDFNYELAKELKLEDLYKIHV